MKILVDTNILISAVLFPYSKPAKALVYITENHELVLCDQNLTELREVLNRKAPQALPDAEVLLTELSYELIPAAYPSLLNFLFIILYIILRLCLIHIRKDTI